ncbi:hypothetical protein LJB77_00275 [Ruminococcaceae bacterium OttesenSCG-928-N02]|nr:hypothetical protein [Ruminococcaceae bacterium OttesenSCG-928-N02]
MKFTKRFFALILTCVLCFGTLAPAFAQTQSDITTQDATATAVQDAIEQAVKWLKWKNWSPKIDEPWLVFALARSGQENVFSTRMQSYQTNLETYVNRNTYLKDKDGEIDYAAYPPSVLAVTSVGKVAHLLSNTDVIMGMSLERGLDAGGPETWAYALIAIDCTGGAYSFTEGGDVERTLIIDRLLSWQAAGGGFAPGGTGSADAYYTAICLQALAKYTAREDVRTAVDDALAFLLEMQAGADRFPSAQQGSLVTSAQVVIALCELGMDPYNFGTGQLLPFILEHQNSNGSFRLSADGNDKNENATIWALMALSAYNRTFILGENALFDLTDVYGSSHNQLSPDRVLGVKISVAVLLLITFSIVLVGLRGLYRQKKWAKLGWLDERGLRMSEQEIAARNGDEEARRQLEEAKARLEKQKEIAEKTGKAELADPSVQDARDEIEQAKARLQAKYGTQRPQKTTPTQEEEYILPREDIDIDPETGRPVSPPLQDPSNEPEA